MSRQRLRKNLSLKLGSILGKKEAGTGIEGKKECIIQVNSMENRNEVELTETDRI
jgi:hypothetical protein